MRYVNSRFKRENQEKIYRIYVTDSLKMVMENTARSVSGGKYLQLRYIEIIDNKPIKEERTGEEIIEAIRKKLQEME